MRNRTPLHKITRTSDNAKWVKYEDQSKRNSNSSLQRSNILQNSFGSNESSPPSTSEQSTLFFGSNTPAIYSKLSIKVPGKSHGSSSSHSSGGSQQGSNSSKSTPKNKYLATPKPDRRILPNGTEIIRVNRIPYLKLKTIGKGGSSEVSEVLSNTGIRYALKIVNTRETDSTVIQNFKNEMILLNAFRGDPNIIQLIDSEIDETRNRICMVLELGQVDLAAVISEQQKQNESIDQNFIRSIWGQMILAVKSVHKKGIIHADLKPANFIFVNSKLKLIDFGVATKVSQQGDTTSVYRTPVGTLNYMPPESLTILNDSTQTKLGRPSDVWSLGCILYQMIFRRYPFPGRDQSVKIEQITNSNYEVDYETFSGEKTSDFYPIVDAIKQCLQRDPKKRPKISQLLQHPFLTNNSQQLENDIRKFIEVAQEYIDSQAFVKEPCDPKTEKFLQHIEDCLLEGIPVFPIPNEDTDIYGINMRTDDDSFYYEE